MRKFLLSFVCLLTMALPSLAEMKTYQLCTDETEILNPDNQFIIISARAMTVSGVKSFYAVKTTTATNGVKVLDDENVPETINLDINSLGLGLFSIKSNGDKYALYENIDGKYWGLPDTNGLTQSSTLPTNDNKYELTVSFNDDSSLKIKSTATAATRTLMFSGGTNFKNYKDASYNAAYAYPLFYKEVVEEGPSNPIYSNFKDEYTISIGEIMPFPAISPTQLEYKFTTEDSDIVEIDEANKTFKALKDGIAVISFSTEAFEDKFTAGSGEFMIEVTKKTPKLSFQDQIVYGKLNVGVVWQELIIEEPADADRSTITYSSSDPTIVTVDPVTGQIKPADIKKTGEVIITATLPSAGDYAEGSESYKILVLDPEAQIEPSTVVFDFSVENPYGMTTQSGSGAGYETKIKEIEGDDVVTVTFEGNYRSWSATGGYQLRIHKDASFTVEVPEGYKITQIGMVADKDGKNMTGEFNPGGSVEEVEGDHAGEWEEVNFHWHAGDKVVGKVKYTNPGAGANDSRDNNDIITKLFVMYEAASSDLKSAELSFTPTVNGIIAGEEATINAVKNPNGREVRYSLSGVEDEKDYSIEPIEDGKKLKVWVKNPGYYTLEARSDAGDGFRDGFAIMRLNVFNHLDVLVDDVKIEEDIIATAGEESKIITFEVVQPQALNIYYRIEDENTPAVDPSEEPDDENCLPGYELYDDMIEIPANTNGKLLFYVANYGYKSPIRTIILGKEETEFKAPALRGIEGLDDDHESCDLENNTHVVMSDTELEIDFDVDTTNPDIQVKYMLLPPEAMGLSVAATTVDEGDDDPMPYENTYNGESILINETVILYYWAINTATQKQTDPVTYYFVFAPKAPELKGIGSLVPYEDMEGVLMGTEAITLSFEEKEGIEIYYDLEKMSTESGPLMSRTRTAVDDDETLPATLYTEPITINETGMYGFRYMAKDLKTGLCSEVKQYAFFLMIEEPVDPATPKVIGLEDWMIVDGMIKCDDKLVLNFETVEGIEIHYSLLTKDEVNSLPVEFVRRKACDRVDDHKGYTKHDGSDIELTGEHGRFSFFACNPETGAHSDIVTYTLAVATGVNEIDAADATDALYFDLNGFRVVNPDKGTYIRITKGKAEKVVK